MDKLAQSVNNLSQAQYANSAASRQVKQDNEELKGGLINLAAGFTIVKQGLDLAMQAYATVSQHVQRAINEALEAEKVNNRLAGALVSVGLYSEQAVKGLDDYAESLEKSKGANGELVKSMIATGVQMGLSVEQAKQMEEAARKLSAATGKDVNEAFSMLQRSLTGQSRGLSLILPQIKEYSEAQLKQGAAIDLVSKSLDAQYKLYQQSLPAALARANVAIDNVYKAFGQIITNSDLTRKAVDLFTATMITLEGAIKSLDKWLTDNKQKIYDFGEAFGKAALIVGGSIATYTLATGAIALMSSGLSVATIAAGAFSAVMAVLASPITLTIGAVAGLTAALYVWPGLFDVVVGGIRYIGATLLDFASGPILTATEAAGYLAGIFDKELGDSISGFSKKIKEQQEDWKAAGAAQLDYGLNSLTASKQVQEAHAANNAAAKSELQTQNDLNKVAIERGKMYGEFDIGTQKQREALQAQVQDRDRDRKDFEQYLADKNRLAVSYEQEQQTAITKFRADQAKGRAETLKGTGSTGAEAEAEAEIAAQELKLEQLEEQRQRGLIDEAEYRAALLQIKQNAAQAELDFEVANKQARADLLGESEEGYAAKQAIEEERFQLELQQKMERAEMENLTEEEIFIMRQELQAQRDQQMLDQRDAHLSAVAAREEVSGATVTATREKWFRQQEKAQAESIKKFASGVAMMESIQTAMNQTFSQLGDALVKNQKITASKFVGIFLEMLGRQVMQKGFADLVMGLFPPNPVQLGVGAAEVAAGTGIARLGVSMQGGQADEGMDSVPGSLAGKSFILSQGERVVQPSANKDLRDFLEREKTGNAGTGGASYNITLNYSGTGSREDASKMADIVIEEIRSRSERGTPIMSSKGLTPA
jgi:hypothetical protein